MPLPLSAALPDSFSTFLLLFLLLILFLLLSYTFAMNLNISSDDLLISILYASSINSFGSRYNLVDSSFNSLNNSVCITFIYAFSSFILCRFMSNFTKHITFDCIADFIMVSSIFYISTLLLLHNIDSPFFVPIKTCVPKFSTSKFLRSVCFASSEPTDP